MEIWVIYYFHWRCREGIGTVSCLKIKKCAQFKVCHRQQSDSLKQHFYCFIALDSNLRLSVYKASAPTTRLRERKKNVTKTYSLNYSEASGVNTADFLRRVTVALIEVVLKMWQNVFKNITRNCKPYSKMERDGTNLKAWCHSNVVAVELKRFVFILSSTFSLRKHSKRWGNVAQAEKMGLLKSILKLPHQKEGGGGFKGVRSWFRNFMCFHLLFSLC